MSIKEIAELPSIFFPSEINSDKEIFYPIACRSSSFDCMVGYFTSGVFSELAKSVSSYLKTSSSNMRFVISPQLNEEDYKAIERAFEKGENFFNILFPGYSYDEISLRNYTVAALSSLIAEGRIELRVALKSRGIFHAKAWFFETEDGGIVIHGSSNATHGGLGENFEQLVLSRSWLSDESKSIYDELRNKFDALWCSSVPGIRTIPINASTMEEIKKVSRVVSRPVEIFLDEYDAGNDESLTDPKEKTLKIPDYVNYKDGPFEHQGKAVDAWMKNGKTGILSIATGGGKTITSLIAAAKTADSVKSLFVVIAVPTKALMAQWEKDVKDFGVIPDNTSGKGKRYISSKVKQCYRNLRISASKVEVLIVTYNSLFSGAFDVESRVRSNVDSLLIADEVHNIGSDLSQERFPAIFQYRIGLSATHERQFDEEGSQFIIDTFGDVVYEYGLDKAIGACLVPFNYYAHFVLLTAEEEEDFQELTAKIKKLSFAANSSDNSDAKERWQQLCIKRRALVENAKGKINKLFEILPKDVESISKTLIFCTDKNPKQLEAVNEGLNLRRLRFHQVTAEETADARKLSRIIAAFSDNELQVLTSKRVLDEGFNIPQIETAYLLASNTVRRQWVQRLGRILRMSPETGKKSSDLYDFIVIPQVEEGIDDDLRSLIEGEYNRVGFFSKYSSNYMEDDGGYNATQRLISVLRD